MSTIKVRVRSMACASSNRSRWMRPRRVCLPQVSTDPVEGQERARQHLHGVVVQLGCQGDALGLGGAQQRSHQPPALVLAVLEHLRRLHLRGDVEDQPLYERLTLDRDQGRLLGQPALLAGREVVDAVLDVRPAVGGVLVSDVVDHPLQVFLGDRIAPRALAERLLGAAEHRDHLRRHVRAAAGRRPQVGDAGKLLDETAIGLRPGRREASMFSDTSVLIGWSIGLPRRTLRLHPRYSV
jgi:hypothetical protein